jgi:hypothetical protein
MVAKHSGRYLMNRCGSIAAGMFLLFIAVLMTSKSYSQSYYFFENRLSAPSGNGLIYHTFLTVETDGSAMARIRYTSPSSGDDRLLELKLVDSFSTEAKNNPDKRYLMAAEGPFLIMGTDDSGFVMPRFIFKQTGSGDAVFYKPAAIETKRDDGNWNATEMTVNQTKAVEELANQSELVSLFFNEQDPFFQFLFFKQSKDPVTIIRNEKLFLIVVANTLDSSIGITSQKDLDNITATFRNMASDLQIKFLPTIISGEGFNKRAVELALTKLNPAPIDIVIFYYSGHGFRFNNDTSKYPRISLRRSEAQVLELNNLGIEDVYNRIVKKGARVSIVLSDCCNDDIGAPVPVGRDIMRTRSSTAGRAAPELNLENCTALFFPNHRVSILTSSAEINQLATGNPVLGGFFTSFFKSLLDKSLYSFEPGNSWLGLLVEAREKARQQALTALCGDSRCVQLATISVIPPQ